ncbi:hypothetical protein [Kitasatospora sp. NPDC050543]|uniref:hypothetical protein n=1 Tax=Kitasatospora sp. NPDC050543 TaxID=3364054 RepID=UPI0037A23997
MTFRILDLYLSGSRLRSRHDAMEGRQHMRKTMLSTLTVMMVAVAGMMPATADAQAAKSPLHRQEAAVTLSYDPPEISEEADHVTWHWTVKNTSTSPVSNVVLSQHLDPPLAGVKASDPCEVAAKVITCRWKSIPAGGIEEGRVDADLPPDLTGTIHISGRIAWERTSGPAAS